MAEILNAPSEALAPSGGLNPAIAGLADAELHVAGQKALDAARQMAPVSKGWRLTKARYGLPPLCVANSSSLRGLSGPNSESAELGLLLALILYRRKIRYDAVVVTGAISGVERGDAIVGPIACIAEKCSAIASWLTAASAAPRTMAFLLPSHDEQGVSTQSRYQGTLEQLRAYAADCGTDLSLHFVESASDAIEVLAGRNVPIDRREVVARVGLVTAVLALALLSIVGHWFLSPTKLSFDTVEWSLGPDPQSPLAVKFDRNLGETRLLTPCFGPDHRLQIGFGEHLVFRAHLVEPGWMDRMLPLFDIAVIVLGETSPPMVFSGTSLPPTDRLSVGNDGSLGFGASIPIAAPEEAMKLVVLVRKGLSNRTDALGSHLKARYEDTAPGEHRLARFGALLAAERGNTLDFDFRAVPKRANCEASR